MNKWRKGNIVALAVLVGLLSLCGCGKKAPEVGKWHADITVSSLSADSEDYEEGLLLSMLTGDLLFEVDAEFCNDGTFTYVINTQPLLDGLSDSVGSILGMLGGGDMSLFVERLFAYACGNALSGTKFDYAGTYTVEDDLVTAYDEESLYFTVDGDTLIQYDADGYEILRLERE